MRDASLDDVLPLNDLLVALAAAGVPVDLGEQHVPPAAGGRAESLDQRMARTNAALQLRVELGQPLERAVDAAPELTPLHRASLFAWLQTERPSAALSGLVQPAQRRSEVRQGVATSLMQLAILCCLLYGAVIFLCIYTVPRLEAIYAQLWKPPTAVLTFLQGARDGIIVWVVAVPIAILLAWLVWRWRASRSTWRWLPGSRRYFTASRHANYADQVATLLDSGLSLEQSMVYAAPLLDHEQAVEPNHLPPLLRWALIGDIGSEPLPQVLRFVATTYRRLAAERSATWRRWVPLLLFTLVGGALVLAYGWLLFLPMTELLQEISLPRGDQL